MATDPNQGPALPPELLALLGGGGGDPTQGAPTPDPTQSLPPDLGANDSSSQGDTSSDNPVDLIQQMIDLAKRYIEVEPDEEDKLTMTKNVLASLQQYLAKDQKEGEEMLQGKLSPRAVRRAGATSGG